MQSMTSYNLTVVEANDGVDKMSAFNKEGLDVSSMQTEICSSAGEMLLSSILNRLAPHTGS